MLHRVVAALEEEGVITHTISHGETKFMGVCKMNEEGLARRLDIRLLLHDQYYCGVCILLGVTCSTRGGGLGPLSRGSL